jgi:organic hydroperoxide reductase OsmC/OhrA
VSEHRATIAWSLSDEFRYEVYPRSHMIDFGRDVCAPGNAAPENVPQTATGAPGADPEQTFVASICACHMLWFLHLACTRKHVVERYRDEASGVLEKNADGKEAITRVTLRPVVTFGGTPPTPEQFAKLHEQAHERCFIANSVKTRIILEPRIA